MNALKNDDAQSVSGAGPVGSWRNVGAPQWLTLVADAFHTRRGRVGAALAAVVVGLSVVGPLVAPHSATEFVTTSYAPPASAAPLGGDGLGRDVLSRVLDGGWELLLMSAIATILGVAAGAAVGIAAAFWGRLTDSILMRTVDVLLAFPQLVLALLLVSIIGPKVWLIVLAVAVAHAPQVARVIRSAALDVCERDFVKSAELIGTSSVRVMGGEILPNLTSPLMVESGLRLTYSIILIAGLSFLGFGLQPPAANWGTMINENRIGVASNPWSVVVPIVLLAVLTIGVNTFTDAVARVSLGVDRRRTALIEAAPLQPVLSDD